MVTGISPATTETNEWTHCHDRAHQDRNPLGKRVLSPSWIPYRGLQLSSHAVPDHSVKGPTKRFPVATVNNILKDVLTSYLQEEKYEAELCRQMTKTISEVIKARVKDLMIPRYKIIVLIHIGQLNDQSMRIGSRCIWDPANDTFSSYSFKNSSLFAVANVYAVYYE
ncbi:dynein light chain Tctex-type 5 isoform X2 [Ambystoma mexicanum]|uniref:dynein light chain Tctex-type 5 isoform X2 n=1 Tax=Ambystoma mexicanum TaxID=8296 RepID=UPI0037E7EC41